MKSPDRSKYRLSLLRVGAVLWCAAVFTGQAAPPANDDFESAYVITGLPVTAEGENDEATRQPGEPDSPEGHGQASLWWRWTTPSPGWVEVSTAGSYYDTILCVYSGHALENLTLLAHNDDILFTEQSRVRFQAEQGVEYRIQVQSWFQDPSMTTLTIQPVAAPQPLVLKRFTVTPDSMVWNDLYEGPVFTAEAEISSPDVLAEATVIITGPLGAAKEEVSFLWSQPGPQLPAVLRTNVYPPRLFGTDGQSLFVGAWSCVVRLRSEFGETLTYGGPGGLPFPEGSNSVSQVSGADDAEAPTITGVTVSPETVDVTDSGKTITVEMAAKDDNQVENVEAFLRDSKGRRLQQIEGFGFPPVIAGTEKEGTWKVNLRLPAFLAPGTYTVTSRAVDIVHRYGRPFEKTITVLNSGVVDITPPEITAVSLGRTRISMTDLPAEIPFRMEISEANTVQSIGCWPEGNWPLGVSDLRRVSRIGNAEVWEGKLAIREGVLPGIFPMRYHASDGTGNQTLFSSGAPPMEGEVSLPVPAGWPATFTITPGPEDAYSVWRAKYPPLASARGEFDVDVDQDGWINAVEFLCGSDPLLPSGPGKADPLGDRLPVFSSTSSALRWEFRLSSENLRGGEGTHWQLQKSGLNSFNPYPEEAVRVTKDLFRAELPITESRGFMRLILGSGRFKVLPTWN